MLDSYLTIGLQKARDGGINETVTAEMLPEGMRFQEYIALKTRERWAAKGVDLSAASDAELSGGTNLYFLFPNFMTFRGPTGHQAYRFRPDGDDPNWTIFEMMALVALPDGEEIPPDERLRMMEPGETFLGSGCDKKMGYQLAYALDQDVANSPRIQKGVHGIARNPVARTMEKNIGLPPQPQNLHGGLSPRRPRQDPLSRPRVLVNGASRPVISRRDCGPFVRTPWLASSVARARPGFRGCGGRVDWSNPDLTINIQRSRVLEASC
jgi:hypothetical protein